MTVRLPASAVRKHVYLQNTYGLSATEVIRQAIERDYDGVAGERESPAEILSRTGFVGCADGPADLSSRYEWDLSASLQKRT